MDRNEEEEGVDELAELNFTTYLSDGLQVSLVPNGAATPVQLENWRDYVEAVAACRLRESAPLLRSLRNGLAAVLPVELFPMFTAEELEKLICGVREVDVELLKSCTEYEEVEESEPHIGYFWSVVEEMRPEERTQLLKVSHT